jgi:DNA-binding CsgD family transcriptional regulator
MFPSDDAEPDQAQLAGPGEPLSRSTFAQADCRYYGRPAGLPTSGGDVHGLLESFADTQQFQLTGPLLTPLGLVDPDYRWSTIQSVLGRITGCSDLPGIVVAQMGDVTVWSMLVEHLRAVYTGALYVAPTQCRSSLVTISLHRVADCEHGSAALTHPSALPVALAIPPGAPTPLSSISFTFVRAFSLVAHQVNRAHSPTPLLPAEGLISLTDVQKEVLSRSADGLSSGEVADLLGCAEATVINHLRGALSVLSCATKPLAVLKAARLGLIPCAH